MVREAGDPPVADEDALVVEPTEDTDVSPVVPVVTAAPHDVTHVEITRLHDTFARVENKVDNLQTMMKNFSTRLDEAEQQAETQTMTPTAVAVPDVAPKPEEKHVRNYNQKRRHK